MRRCAREREGANIQRTQRLRDGVVDAAAVDRAEESARVEGQDNACPAARTVGFCPPDAPRAGRVERPIADRLPAGEIRIEPSRVPIDDERGDRRGAGIRRPCRAAVEGLRHGGPGPRHELVRIRRIHAGERVRRTRRGARAARSGRTNARGRGFDVRSAPSARVTIVGEPERKGWPPPPGRACGFPAESAVRRACRSSGRPAPRDDDDLRAPAPGCAATTGSSASAGPAGVQAPAAARHGTVSANARARTRTSVGAFMVFPQVTGVDHDIARPLPAVAIGVCPTRASVGGATDRPASCAHSAIHCAVSFSCSAFCRSRASSAGEVDAVERLVLVEAARTRSCVLPVAGSTMRLQALRADLLHHALHRRVDRADRRSGPASGTARARRAARARPPPSCGRSRSR